MGGRLSGCRNSALVRRSRRLGILQTRCSALGCEDALRSEGAFEGIKGKRLTYRSVTAA
jgi:hypothetical protein